MIGFRGTTQTRPVCSSPLMGRQISACSDKCWATKSRRGRAKALGALHEEVREFLLEELNVLEKEDRK